MKNEPSLLLKFSGEGLDVRSIPIYELGDTLVAVQRIIHKAFLFDKDRLRKGAKLTQDERQRLALQISERRKSSDAYALIPFVIDPTLQEYVLSLLKVGLGTLAKYALKSVLSDAKDPGSGGTSIHTQDVQGSVLVGAIYAETIQITNHISNIGGIDSIEFIPSPELNIPTVKFTTDTQSYVREIENASYRAHPEEIVGYVTRLHPNRMLAEIKLGPSRYVRVGLDEESFRFVRYDTEPEQQLRFKGCPVVKLGNDLNSFEFFDAESVELDV